MGNKYQTVREILRNVDEETLVKVYLTTEMALMILQTGKKSELRESVLDLTVFNSVEEKDDIVIIKA